MFKPLYAFPSLCFTLLCFDKDISLFVHIYITGSFTCIWFFFHWIFIFFFFFSWLAVGCSITIFFLIGEPYERGFFCNDEDLMHPYHKSTVKHWMLFVFGVIIPVVIVSISFFFHFYEHLLMLHGIHIWNFYTYGVVWSIGMETEVKHGEFSRFLWARCKERLYFWILDNPCLYF